MMLLVLTISVALQIGAFAVPFEPTIQLDDHNFKAQIKANSFFVSYTKDRPIFQFVRFWDKIGGIYNTRPDSGLKLGEVDCLKSPKICQKNGITEPLTVKFHAKKGDTFDPQPMAKFFNDKIEKTMKAVVLEDAAYNELSKSKATLVKFYIDDCPDCINFLPAWEEIERKYKNSKSLQTMRINCKNMEQFCMNFEISFYPTVIWAEKGVTKERITGTGITLANLEFFIDNMKV